MSDEVLAALSALGRVLTKVLLAQAVGYWMKSSKSIPDAALTGIGAFAGLVSLPALLFKAVAVLDFSQVDITLVVALTLGKLLLVAISATSGRSPPTPALARQSLPVAALACSRPTQTTLALGCQCWAPSSHRSSSRCALC